MRVRRRSKSLYVMAALAITVAAVVAYRNVIFVGDPALRYPWSSDAWGHLIKAEYLLEQMRLGHWYPDLFPQWYSGQQMLRYYAPLPYYILVGLLLVTGDTFVAGNWFLFLTALAGGLSMLLYARRLGLAFATVGGILLVWLPDNIRVAFAEGNLPRILAASLLPATFYFFLNVLTGEGRRKVSFAAVAVLMSLVVISHAMMGAIFGAAMTLTAVAYWFIARANSRNVGLAVLAVFTGILLSGWWLLPSLTGGITELNVEAAGEALAYFPLNVALHPFLRRSQPEIFYVGVSLMVGVALALYYWRRITPLVKALFVAGVLTVMISSTLFNELYNSLPFSQLFWPIRFMTFAGFALILATMALSSAIWRMSGPRERSVPRFVVIGLLVLMALDFWQSTPLIKTREAPPEVMEVAQRLQGSQGWRVATVDLSQLGSAPSYLFSSVGGKEQVYGWAYQGATTAPLLARINQALEKGFTAYAVDRLERLGADDVVVLNTLPQMAYQISKDLPKALEEAGYRRVYHGQRIDWYHKDGVPRAYKVETSVVAVGSGGENLSLLFPEVLPLSETVLDDLDVDFLARFDTVILAGFQWKSKKRAEEMVRELVARGKRVFIDLTGAPVDPLSQIPSFLGVYAERVLMLRPPVLKTGDETLRLRPFDPKYVPWQVYVPQGLDSVDVSFDMMGLEGAVLGEKRVDGGSVTFLGMNLMFHAILTRDPAAIGVLEEWLGIKANRRPALDPIPLEGYTATQASYRFEMETSSEDYYLIPMAYHQGMTVYVDGRAVPSLPVDTLVLASLPQGRHQVELRPLRTPIYRLGQMSTAAALLIMALVALRGTRLGLPRPLGQRRPIPTPPPGAMGR